MRLINCSTLQLEEFFGSNIPQYAILSHTWGSEEVSFSDFVGQPAIARAKEGYKKIEFTCAQASWDGLEYAWIDTCCIDKSSSSELSEAINSMFAWYRDSAKCYAYLSDVSRANMYQEFPKSRWFTRGWTLQELLAPKDVIFYDQDWDEMSTRSNNAEEISRIAGIDAWALSSSYPLRAVNEPFSSFCVATKMSWASRRETTRLEDIAYCLLGIFNVNMPLLYGEGNSAFVRLQEEIIRRTDDHSILAWGLIPEMDHPLGLVSEPVKMSLMHRSRGSDLLASSPADFKNCANLRYTLGSASPFTLTNVGLQIELPLIPANLSHSPEDYGWVGLLNCSSDASEEMFGIPLIQLDDEPHNVRTMSRIPVFLEMGTFATLIVGPRAAISAATSSVIISRNRIIPSSVLYNQLFMVNISKHLRKMGYEINSFSIITTDEGGVITYLPSKWNPETQTLSLEASGSSGQVVQLCFKPPRNGPGSPFTLYLHTVSCKVILRQGENFSWQEKGPLYHELELPPTNTTGSDYVMTLSHGGPMFRVRASVYKTVVHHRQLFEITVQAVR